MRRAIAFVLLGLLLGGCVTNGCEWSSYSANDAHVRALGRFSVNSVKSRAQGHVAYSASVTIDSSGVRESQSIVAGCGRNGRLIY